MHDSVSQINAFDKLTDHSLYCHFFFDGSVGEIIQLHINSVREWGFYLFTPTENNWGAIVD